VDKDRLVAEGVGENFFGLSADMDKLSQSLDDYFLAVQNFKATIVRQEKQIQSNLEAVKSVDAFRRQVSQKIIDLEKQVEKQAVIVPVKTQSLDQQSNSSTLSP
jgi:hypothetical protein